VPFHVQISGEGTNEWGGIFAFDLSRKQLEERVLAPYRSGSPITVGGQTVQPGPGVRVRITETDRPSVEQRTAAQSRARRNARQIGSPATVARWEVVFMGFGTDRTDEFVVSPPGGAAQSEEATPAVERLILLCRRFPRVARKLLERGRGRSPVTIDDEYDLQYIVAALLALEFDDIRAEEWTPSYAGSSAKVDFLLKKERVVLELKRTRAGLGDKEVGNQLIEDIARYRGHAKCDSLVCFIYDPDRVIANPDGLVDDLERSPPAGLYVRAVIAQ
jgi:DpnII restriction endonuclease